ncbi:MAG: hypothetical protein GXO94_05585 [Nitrospirae bacterium]|nr:hypothetical protein [Nitrospirota bacterium]
MDVGRFIEQVKLNCNISDATFWGYYSMCGMLMRLRELYRSEHSLMPWDPLPKEDISVWIASREALWEELEDEDLRPLEIGDRRYGPFDVERINAVLNTRGLVYGGGYGRFNKPTFFLSTIEREREVHGCRVYYAGRELCRDLSTSAAMLQGRSIFIRLEPLRSLLWDKYLELQGRRFGGALREAFATYGIDGTRPPEEVHGKIETLGAEVSEILLLHELGEAFEHERSGEWLDMLVNTSDRWSEFYIRGVKDLLADTSDMGPLKSIVARRHRAQLCFYVVLLDGIRKELFPEMMNAFQVFAEDGDWSVIEEARVAGYRRAVELMEALLTAWRAEGDVGDVRTLIRAFMGAGCEGKRNR